MKVWVQIAEGRWRLMDDTDSKIPTAKPDAPFVRNEFISAEEKRKLRLQLGENFDSESAVRRYMKDNGLRMRESGDRLDQIRKARKEWLRDTKPGERGKNPVAGPLGYSHA